MSDTNMPTKAFAGLHATRRVHRADHRETVGAFAEAGRRRFALVFQSQGGAPAPFFESGLCPEITGIVVDIFHDLEVRDRPRLSQSSRDILRRQRRTRTGILMRKAQCPSRGQGRTASMINSTRPGIR
jgi:hypothetical protein